VVRTMQHLLPQLAGSDTSLRHMPCLTGHLQRCTRCCSCQVPDVNEQVEVSLQLHSLQAPLPGVAIAA